MSSELQIKISAWNNGDTIPEKFAFGKYDKDNHVALSDNVSPEISWSNAPAGTKSFALICHDSDVPSVGDDVNQEGKVVSADLPRVDFFHWVLVNIPVGVNHIAEGAASNGITPRGKKVGQKEYGLAGINDYTAWFEGDAEMDGSYGDYDGPCPPWNDSIIHHYYFTVYALDIELLDLTGSFNGAEVMDAIENHILDKSSHIGIYSLNPNVV